MIKPGIYKHFKGNIYQVFETVLHSETKEELVLYKRENNKQFWVRPISMFEEIVEKDGEKMPRFLFVDAS